VAGPSRTRPAFQLLDGSDNGEDITDFDEVPVAPPPRQKRDRAPSVSKPDESARPARRVAAIIFLARVARADGRTDTLRTGRRGEAPRQEREEREGHGGPFSFLLGSITDRILTGRRARRGCAGEQAARAQGPVSKCTNVLPFRRRVR
jgi:hypothetical protein